MLLMRLFNFFIWLGFGVICKVFAQLEGKMGSIKQLSDISGNYDVFCFKIIHFLISSRNYNAGPLKD